MRLTENPPPGYGCAIATVGGIVIWLLALIVVALLVKGLRP